MSTKSKSFGKILLIVFVVALGIGGFNICNHSYGLQPGFR